MEALARSSVGQAAYEATCSMFARGRAAWPQLRLPEAQFFAHVARYQADQDRYYMHADDLYLAVACLRNVSGAPEAFQRVHRPAVIGCLRRVGKHPDSIDELCQTVFTRVLVGTEDQPARLNQYCGRSPLGAWLMVVARRTLLNARRTSAARRRLARRVEKEPYLLPPDPFDLLVKRRATGPMNEALALAIASLSPRDRQLLRFTYEDGLSTVQVAQIFVVNHSTVSRWLAEARRLLRLQVEDQLRWRCGVSTQDVWPLLMAAWADLKVTL
jgi:RNA polymerase sigma-70 factor (ECF subfamily)